MKKPRVLVTSNETPQIALDLLRTKCDLTIISTPGATRDQILEVVSGHDAILLMGHSSRVDKEFLDVAGPTLKIISFPYSGYEPLDVVEIKKRGIKVGIVSRGIETAVAELALMLLLRAQRLAHEGRLKLKQNEIETRPQFSLGVELEGSTVGIVGLGKIGQEIVKRLKCFDIGKILYSGHSRKKAGDELEAEFVSLDELLEQSDFVIVAVPLTPETLKMFDDNTFTKMKKTAVFINVGRGKVVDTDSLVKALKNKTIFAAGLDVVDPEPLPPDHELLKLPNVEIMPHKGGYTWSVLNHRTNVGAQNIINALEGKPMVFPL